MAIKIPDKKTFEIEYSNMKEIYNDVLFDFSKKIKHNLDNMQIHYNLKYRVKSFESYYKKYIKKYREFGNKHSIDITDVMALRVICFFLEDIKEVEKMILEKYSILEEERKGDTQSFKEFGYNSIHFLVKLPVDLLIKYGIENQMVCEIQIRTILQDAWAEVEHEIVYKAEDTILNDTIKRKMAALNATLTLSDIIFQEIRDMQKFLNTESQKRRQIFLDELERNVEEKFEDNIEYTEENKKNKKLINEKKQNNKLTKQQEQEQNNKEEIEKLLLEALTAHNSRNFKKAIDIYCEIINMNPKPFIKSIVLIHRGMAYFVESYYEEAIIDFSVVLQEDPYNIKANYYRGMLHGIKKEYDKAIHDFNAVIEKDPFNFKAWYGRAKIYHQIGDIMSAIYDCEEAIKIEPESQELKKFLMVLNEKIQ